MIGQGCKANAKKMALQRLPRSPLVFGKRVKKAHQGSSTPAGQMYSPSKGYTGVVTCGHGYSLNDKVSIFPAYWTPLEPIGKITAHKFVTLYGSWNDSSFIKLDNGHSYSGTRYDEICTQTPVVNSNITLRGYNFGTKSAKVTSINASCVTLNPLMNMGNLIKADKPVYSGDSGGGAIGGTADGGRTNLIIGINHATDSYNTWLVMGSTVHNGFK